MAAPASYCSSCKRNFPSQQAYMMHTGSRIHSLSHKCTQCKNYFPSDDCLREHTARLHPESLQSTTWLFCKDCTINFVTEKGLLDHRALIHSCCPVCKAAFASQAALYEHRKSCHDQASGQNPVKLPNGNGLRQGVDVLRPFQHVKRDLPHSEQTEQMQAKQVPMVLDRVNIGKPSQHAAVRLSAPSCLNAVQDTKGPQLSSCAQPQQATQAPLVLEQATAKKKIQPVAGYNFDCQHCNKQFASRSALERHARDSHRHPRRFLCSDCENMAFYLKSSLELHQENDYLHQQRVAERTASAVPSSSKAPDEQRKSSDQLQTLGEHKRIAGQVQREEQVQTGISPQKKERPPERKESPPLAERSQESRAQATQVASGPESKLPMEQPRLQALVQQPAITVRNAVVVRSASNGLLGPGVEPQVLIQGGPRVAKPKHPLQRDPGVEPTIAVQDAVKHDPPRPKAVSCQKCSREFSSLAALLQHSTMSHPEQERFACFFCGASFPSSVVLERHAELFHAQAAAGGGPSCPWCKRVFDSQMSLSQHMRDSHVCRRPPPSQNGVNPPQASNQRQIPGGQTVQRPSTAGQPRNAWVARQSAEVPTSRPMTAQQRGGVAAEGPVCDDVAGGGRSVGSDLGAGVHGFGGGATRGSGGMGRANGARAPAVESGRQVDAEPRPASLPKAPPVPERASNREEECIICLDARRDTLYVPCAHFSFCHQCAMDNYEKGNPCPECRSPIESVLQL